MPRKIDTVVDRQLFLNDGLDQSGGKRTGQRSEHRDAQMRQRLGRDLPYFGTQLVGVQQNFRGVVPKRVSRGV